MQPYGWREGQVWGEGANKHHNVTHEEMGYFLIRAQGSVWLTGVAEYCIEQTFGKTTKLGYTQYGPNELNILATHNGETRVFRMVYPENLTPYFEPKFFGEDMMACKQSELDVEQAEIVSEAKGLDPYMSKKIFGEMLGYKKTAGRKKATRKRSTRRKHTLVKRRNVRVNRLRTLKTKFF